MNAYLSKFHNIFGGKCVADLYYEPHREDEVWEMVSVGVDGVLLAV